MCVFLQSLRCVRRQACCLLLAGLFAGVSCLWAGQGAVALDLSGKPVNPFKASHGKMVVLLFVRTDCPISNRYAPEIQRLSAEHSSNVRFWLVYPDKKETAQNIRAHDKEYGYSISALRDTEHALVKFAEATITPEAALFARDGRLVYHGRIDDWFVEMGRARSAPTTHDLEDAIEAAVKSPSVSVKSAQAVGCYIADLD